MLDEKSLVGKGKRQLFLLDNNVALVEYAGVRKAKFVSKDAERYEQMVEQAVEKHELDEENIKKVLLLADNGTMCRRNTLPRLHRNNVIVMRCPRNLNDDDEESSSNGDSE